ncbi:MAG: Rne/Rng family ribonuclease [Paracoccaceae bacterium]
MAKKMLIDATHPEETRVVVVDGNKVEDFDFESINKRQLAGNIYLAKVTRVEPSLQAAFVEYGGNRHGFLAFSEVHPDYYQIPIADREALLAEEEREEEEQRRREEDSEAEERPKRRRRKPRAAQSDKDNGDSDGGDDTSAAAAPVAGLEVIDIDPSEAVDAMDFSAGGSVPRGLEMADAIEGDAAQDDAADAVDDGAADPELADTDTAENTDDVASADTAGDEDPAPADGTQNDTSGAADPVEVAQSDTGAEATEPEPVAESASATDDAAPEPTVAAETSSAPLADDVASDALEPDAKDTAEHGDLPPKTVAEAAGLDDDDRISEDAETARKANSVAADETPDAPIETETDAPDNAVVEETQDATDEPQPAPEAETAPEGATASDASPDQPSQAADADADADASAASDVEADGNAPVADTSEQTDPEPEGAEAAADSTATSQANDADAAQTESASDDEQEAPRKPRRRRKPRNDRKQSVDDSDGDANDDVTDEVEQVGADDVHEEVASTRIRARRRYKIQDVIKVRQILLVQVVKEERGNKGAALTTYLSLAGRYCVLMPNTARGGGISRKIVNAADRKRLREITNELEVPKGMGLIVRTAGADRTRAEIKRDYEFLTRQWEQIRDLTLKSVAPALIYEEGSLIKRSIRDIYSKEIDQIQVEGEQGYREAKEYMKMLMPSHAKNVQPYADPIPLFSRYQVESYLNGMFNPTVQLKSGGYIVIGVTEALVAIDVNSGRATKQGSIEETAVQTYLEAADEVARQLRLRALAGLIVIDFIDMDENRNNRAVEKRMKDRLKTDRARIQVGRISAFGLMEMSRQRLRPGMLEATTQPCPTCHGVGLVRSDENLTLSILREVEEEGVRSRANQITIKVPVSIANYLINHKRETLAQIEERHGVSVAILAAPLLSRPNYDIERSRSQTNRPVRQSDVVTSSSVVSNDDLGEEAETVDPERDDDAKSRRRRGKRGGRRRRGEDKGEEAGQESEAQDTGSQDNAEDGSGDEGDDDRPRRSRRGGRRRRGGRNRKGGDEANGTENQEATGMAVVDLEEPESDNEGATADPATAEVSEPSETTASVDAVDTGDASPEVTAAESDPTQIAEAPTDSTSEEDSADQAADPDPVEDPAEPELVAEIPAEPEAPAPKPEPVLETVAADSAPDPESPPKPKRRGWWSFGR